MIIIAGVFWGKQSVVSKRIFRQTEAKKKSENLIYQGHFFAS